MMFLAETKPPANGIGSVLSQIVLCKSMKPDFNAEEKVSIEKDTRELRIIIGEMAECLPKEDPEKGEGFFCSIWGSFTLRDEIM